jgi:hypothetical protein
MSGNDQIKITHLDCFGTGITDSGRLQRPDRCDACPEVRPCLIRQCLLAAGRTMSPPDAVDRFIPEGIRLRTFPRRPRG